MPSAPDLRPTLAAPDDDPYLWLEDVEAARALEWVDAQTTRTLARLADARYEADRDTLRTLLDRPENLPVPTRRGGLIYNFWRDAEHPRGLWRRTTLAAYRTETPNWDILLDLDALAATEAEDWVWHGAQTHPPEHRRALLRLSRGGSDAVVLREYDLQTRAFVPDGFHLPQAKGGADWLDADTLLLSTALGGTTTAGYARTARLWHRGQPWDAQKPLFETAPDNMSAWAQYDRITDRILFGEALGFFDVAFRIGDRTGPQQTIDLPTDVSWQWEDTWLAAVPRTPWTLPDCTLPDRTLAPDTLVVIRRDAFLAGARDFQIVFEPQPRRSLQGFTFSAGKLILSVLDDLRPRFFALTPGAASVTSAARDESGAASDKSGAASAWSSQPIANLPDLGTVSLWPLDADYAEGDGTLLAAAQDPLTPPTLLLTRPDQPTPELLRSLPPGFDATGLVVTRHEAIAPDGERIPYVQCGPAEPSGDAPVYMTGYGGFGLSVSPSYRAGLGKLWLERGGTTVLAHLRGGREFGIAWHEAGRRAGKRASHDDFAAIAADLVARGVTRPSRIAAEGGSNGGLLIANMLTRYPERFGALFCTIPLIDMRRYAQLLAGASWIAEYGDPATTDWDDFLAPLSAYHAAQPGQPYPPILLATTRRDDRVHPGHARKMAAKLQALGYDALFYEPAAGGHGYGKDNAELAAFTALGYAFMRRAIGWEPPA